MQYLSGATKAVPVGSATSFSHMPLTKEAKDDFTRRILKDLQMFVDPDNRPDEESLRTWAARTSTSSVTVKSQLILDLDLWKNSIQRIVQMRVYSWRQLERIQLMVMQGLVNFADQSEGLTELLKSLPDIPGAGSNSLDQANQYMIEFSRLLVKFFETTKQSANDLHKKIEGFHHSLDNEQFAASNEEFELLGLPPETQNLCSRVRSFLEAKLQLEISDILNLAPEKLGFGLPAAETSVSSAANEYLHSSSQLLVLAHDAVLEICREMSIEPNDLKCSKYHHSVISYGDIQEFVPLLAQTGGLAHRIVVADEERLPVIEQAITNMGLNEAITLLPSVPSLGTHVICEAGQLNLATIAGTLWRATGATVGLAERVRTRVDIDWEPIGNLLDRSRFQQSDSQVPVTPELPKMANGQAAPLISQDQQLPGAGIQVHQ
jgi:hypothetical protein